MVGLKDRLGRRRYKLVHPDGKQRLRIASRLVLEAFVGPDDRFALHDDGDYSNNRLSNLYYGTHRQNMEDRERHGNTPRGERNGEAKITAADALAIRNRFAAGDVYMKDLAAEYGITGTQVSAILSGKNWAAVGGPIFKRPQRGCGRWHPYERAA